MCDIVTSIKLITAVIITAVIIIKYTFGNIVEEQLNIKRIIMN